MEVKNETRAFNKRKRKHNTRTVFEKVTSNPSTRLVLNQPTFKILRLHPPEFSDNKHNVERNNLLI